MRWLLTGGAGFIGFNLALTLARAGETVVLLDKRVLRPDQESAVEDLDVEVVHGCITQADGGQRAFDGVGVIVHLAAIPGLASCEEDRAGSFATNVLGTERLLEAAAGLSEPPVFVFVSSAAAGRVDSLYGGQKAAAEALVKGRRAALPAAIVRPTNVYGPWSRHKSSVLHAFAKAALEGKALTVHGDGLQVREPVYVGDVASAIRAVASQGALRGETYEVGGGVAWSVAAMAELVRKVEPAAAVRHVGHCVGPRTVPLANLHGMRHLGWEPSYGLREGFGRTLRWYRETQA